MCLFLTSYFQLPNFKIGNRELEKALTSINNTKPTKPIFLSELNLQIGNTVIFIDKNQNKKPNYSDFAIF
ncbi:MAG: hypothetical protein CEE42_04225 [Promethearchaeota archaeon Loki_b31]|nr:MAG: hypothetical protein CEE42_04225 [Candidatus Lokiarchaeota archaeon Loki_b31]